MTLPVQTPQRIAIVHEWFTGMRGGEKCVEALCELFPQAHLFALLHVKGTASPTIERMPVRTSFVQQLPFTRDYYRYYLPLFPAAIRQFDLQGYDLIISSSHCVAKGVRTPRHTLHICYCHSPMRYIWNQYDEYFGRGRAGMISRIGMSLFVRYLRRWDVQTAAHPHYFVANSENVRQRIRSIYDRSSDVIYPPVDTSLFALARGDQGYYLVVSAFVPYKRVDLAIEVFNRTKERLVVVGDGPDAQRLQRLSGRNIEFVGWQPNEKLREFYAGCRAVIFPGEEDFGIVPVEAMATGKPVVAFARGGALETVVDTPGLRTGLLFPEQTVDSLLSAVRRLGSLDFDPEASRAFALGFDREVFKRRMKEYVELKWSEFGRRFARDAQ